MEYGDKIPADDRDVVTKANDELKGLAAKKNVTLPASLDAKHKALQQKLEKQKGAAFDSAYMEEMVKDHQQAVALFQREAKSGKDPDTKAWAEKTLPTLQEAAEGCKGCDLYQHATQTVFGDGPSGARIMLVGEQPGRAEDLEGAPLFGRGGRRVRRAPEEAGIDLRDVYLTNVVKHFKWEPRGKRRIHNKPRHS